MRKFLVMTLLLLGFNQAAFAREPSSFEAVDMLDLTAGNVPTTGAATLTRTRQSLNVHIVTTGLLPGNLYTVWFVLFHKPENCVDGCNGPDLGAADGAVIFGSSFVADSIGGGTVDASLDAGQLAEGRFYNPALGDRLRPGHGMTVETHMVVAGHNIPAAGDWDTESTTPAAGVQAALFIP